MKKNNKMNAKRITKHVQLRVRTGLKVGVNFCESIDTCRQYCTEQGNPYDKAEHDCRCDCYP